MQVTLIRHGKTEGNLKRRYIGRTDEPLCDEGIAEAQRLGKDYSLEEVYVSPLMRARETADILFPNAKQIIVNDFREMDFGIFENRSADEMAFDSQYRKWVEDMCVSVCPQGESIDAFVKRVVAAFTYIVSRTEKDCTFVVHGGTVMAILSELAADKKGFYDWTAPNLGGYTADVAYISGKLALCNIKRIIPTK